MKLLLRVVLLLLGAIPLCSFSEVHLVGSNRVIFDKGNRVRLGFENASDRDALVKIDIVWGGTRNEDVPLAVAKPLLAIPALSQRSVEIFYQGKGLPKDRESYFLLRVLDVPTKPKRENTAQIALRHYYKLFYRPSLDFQSQDLKEYLSVRAIKNGGLELMNSSPYFITLSNVRLSDEKGSCEGIVSHVMVAPFSRDGLSSPCARDVQEVDLWLVGDSGKEVEVKIKVEKSL